MPQAAREKRCRILCCRHPAVDEKPLCRRGPGPEKKEATRRIDDKDRAVNKQRGCSAAEGLTARSRLSCWRVPAGACRSASFPLSDLQQDVTVHGDQSEQGPGMWAQGAPQRGVCVSNGATGMGAHRTSRRAPIAGHAASMASWSWARALTAPGGCADCPARLGTLPVNLLADRSLRTAITPRREGHRAGSGVYSLGHAGCM